MLKKIQECNVYLYHHHHCYNHYNYYNDTQCTYT